MRSLRPHVSQRSRRDQIVTEVKQTAAGRWSVIAWTRLRLSLVSGLGGFLTIYALAQLGASLATMLLIAPFGATCVLVFAVPQSPISRPKNVVAGHLVSSLVGLAVLAAIGEGPLSLGIATGLAITMMQASGTLHPPAGADPIVILAGGVSWSFLLTPILVGASVIIVLGWCYHRLVSGRACWGTVTSSSSTTPSTWRRWHGLRWSSAQRSPAASAHPAGWDPRTRTQLLDQATTAGASCDPMVAAAAELIKRPNTDTATAWHGEDGPPAILTNPVERAGFRCRRSWRYREGIRPRSVRSPQRGQRRARTAPKLTPAWGYPP